MNLQYTVEKKLIVGWLVLSWLCSDGALIVLWWCSGGALMVGNCSPLAVIVVVAFAASETSTTAHAVGQGIVYNGGCCREWHSREVCSKNLYCFTGNGRCWLPVVREPTLTHFSRSGNQLRRRLV